MKTTRKGIENSIWIIITIVVALATALALIILLNTTSSNTQNNILPILSQAADNIKAIISGTKNN